MPDRYTLDGPAVLAARAAGDVPVGVVAAGQHAGAGGSAPRVLLTMGQHAGSPRVEAAYVRCVLAAGGQPLLVAPGEPGTDALLDHADALVLTGGAFDIHPRHYGRDVAARLDTVDEDRTVMELTLAREALRRGLPVLGICGGMQALAVVAGGTLVQDLPAEPTHEQPTDPALAWHEVRLTGRLAAWLGHTVAVNSTHHQAVEEAGSGFAVEGRSPDGVIEAMVARAHPFAVGVQWHPERLGDGRLYEALVQAARTPNP